ncbi:MAG: hypothetical protein PHH60_04265 [Candidatus Margulisbacteria bacterium]|nr:hypothetical protein [Candidatus Margulisiibacteriota bacterium]
MPLTGREKATIFLSILGADNSSRVLRYLPDELADLIASGINHLPSPSPEALSEVLGEFSSFLALPEAPSARVPRIEERPRPVKPRKSYALLVYERPQMIAYLISILPAEEKEDALQSLTRDRSYVQELLSSLKQNPITPKLEALFKEQYKGKLFS